MTDLLKKRKEYLWTAVFIAHINKQYGFDYVAEIYESEDEPIDTVAVSATATYPKLKFQLTYAVELPFAYKGNEIEPDYSAKPTVEAIERKNEKFQNHHIYMDDIILIVEGYMNEEQARSAFPEELREKYKDYYFQGIYYVAPKMISDDSKEAIQESYVITLKDAFKEKTGN
jgi:hypothetical protein